MSKVIYETLILSFVCENRIQMFTTLKHYECKVQFHGCHFLHYVSKNALRIHCKEYAAESQASSLEQRLH